MNPDGISALLQHWELVVFVLALLGAGWAIMGRVFKLFFWNEDRIEKVANKLLGSDVVKKTMTEVARGVFEVASVRDNEIRAEMRALLADLKKRDEERAAAITRVHQRQDEMQTNLMKWMGDLAAGKNRE